MVLYEEKMKTDSLKLIQRSILTNTIGYTFDVSLGFFLYLSTLHSFQSTNLFVNYLDFLLREETW